MQIRETFTYFTMAPHIGCIGGNTATAAGTAVDRQGYDSLTFNINIMQISTVTSAMSALSTLAANSNPATSFWFVRMQHQDGSAAGLDAATAWADCLSIEVIRPWSGAMTSGVTNAGIVLYVDNSTMSGTVQKVGYRGNKRFVRCLLSMTNMTMGASNVMAIESMLGHAENWPVSTPNLDS
jgi:hypothetical protein